jgi:hypothetical protein
MAFVFLFCALFSNYGRRRKETVETGHWRESGQSE